MTSIELSLTHNLELEDTNLGIDNFDSDRLLDLNLVNISNNTAYLDASIDFDLEDNSFSSSRSLTIENINSNDALDRVVAEFFDDFVTNNFDSDDHFDYLPDISFDELDTDQTINNSFSHTLKDSNNLTEITVTMLVDQMDTAVNLVGSNDNDVLRGNGGDDTLNGLEGDDVIYGAGGDDIIVGGMGKDIIQGGDGNDFLSGNNGNNLLFGNEGNDSLGGNNGNDLLLGGKGKDLLNGGVGEDTLIGETFGKLR